jgi:predicted DNA-binding transcriptional regulator AlpA
MIRTKAGDLVGSGHSERLAKPVRFIRLGEVIDRTGIPKSTVYSMIAAGKFPAPIQITPRRVAWLENEVSDWQANQIAASRPEAAHAG